MDINKRLSDAVKAWGKDNAWQVAALDLLGNKPAATKQWFIDASKEDAVAQVDRLRTEGVAEGQRKRGREGEEEEQEAPPFKRNATLDKISPSAMAKITASEIREKLTAVVPKPSTDPAAQQKNLTFIAGRPCDAAVVLAEHAIRLAPEFGYLRDAASGKLKGFPPEHFVKAWHDLIKIAAKFHRHEHMRTEAFRDWWNKWYPGLHMKAVPANTSSSSSSSSVDHERRKGMDGCIHVIGPEPECEERAAAIYEDKNEMDAGDPTYERIRYMQAQYKNGLGWWKDDLLCGTGAPCLGMDMAGPRLVLSGMAIVRSNVVLSELLCFTLDLLDIGARWVWYSEIGPTMLAALAVSTWHLQLRYRKAAGSHQARSDMDKAEVERREQKQAALVQEVLCSLQCPEVNYARALESVLLTCAEAEAVAGMRRSQPSPLTSPFPYPLWSQHSSSSRYTKYRDVKRLGLEDMDSKLVFTAVHPDTQQHVFIKFVNHRYPKEIHMALSTAGLTPQLVEVVTLPGDLYMVVTQLLDTSQWVNLCTMPGQIQAVAKRLRSLLAQVHGLSLMGVANQQQAGMCSPAPTSMAGEGSSTAAAVQGRIVLGDARCANVMAEVERGAHNAVLCVKRLMWVDLDWAGYEGVSRYPPIQFSPHIAWHTDVCQGAIMRQEHDVHLLNRELGAAGLA